MNFCDMGLDDAECPCIANMRKVLPDIVAEFGHAVTHYNKTDEHPVFGHTIGLYAKYGYEVIVTGIHPDTVAPLLNDVVDLLLKPAGGVVFDTPSLVISEHHDPEFKVRTQFRRCTPQVCKDYGREAARYAGVVEVPLAQVVLSDEEGRFPEDPGYDHATMEPQALLYQLAH